MKQGTNMMKVNGLSRMNMNVMERKGSNLGSSMSFVSGLDDEKTK